MNRTSAKKLTKTKKEMIINKITQLLEVHQEISFAYVHGSFLQEGDFNDIDVAVYLKEAIESPLQYELQTEAELMKSLGMFVADVRVLNFSPLSFRYHVIKEGRLLMVRDDDIRADFQENTIKHYLDFAPFRKMYLKEVLGLGV
jgi:hypothetical protein